MQRDRRHGMHVRFSDILDYNRDVEIPCPDSLVVRRRNKSAVVINEGDCVYGS